MAQIVRRRRNAGRQGMIFTAMVHYNIALQFLNQTVPDFLNCCENIWGASNCALKQAAYLGGAGFTSRSAKSIVVEKIVELTAVSQHQRFPNNMWRFISRCHRHFMEHNRVTSEELNRNMVKIKKFIDVIDGLDQNFMRQVVTEMASDGFVNIGRPI